MLSKNKKLIKYPSGKWQENFVKENPWIMNIFTGIQNWSEIMWKRGEFKKAVEPDDKGWYDNSEVSSGIQSYIWIELYKNKK